MNVIYLKALAYNSCIISRVTIQKSCGASFYPSTEDKNGQNAKFDKSYWILKTSYMAADSKWRP